MPIVPESTAAGPCRLTDTCRPVALHGGHGLDSAPPEPGLRSAEVMGTAILVVYVFPDAAIDLLDALAGRVLVCRYCNRRSSHMRFRGRNDIDYMRPLLLSLLLVLSALGAGCAMVPAQEMSDARQAIHAAEVAGADTHSPRALNHARTLLEQAQAELAAQDYAAARRSAQESKEAAIQAREAADDVTRIPPRSP